MKLFKSSILALFLAASASGNAQSFDWSSLTNLISNTVGSETTSSVVNQISNAVGTDVSGIVDHLLKTDDLNVADLAGSWRSSGSAVSFESEDLLNKAGGIAAASTIEGKLDPYYKKMGLENVTFTFTADGNVTITLKNGKKFSGTVTKGEKPGTMVFAFSKLKMVNLTAYVSKGTTLSIMFDASKLVSFVSSIAKNSGISSFSTIATLLKSYDKVYAGFKFEKQ